MPWHLAILGRGSAAAYYLNTLDRSRYPKIVVIGEDDPWKGQRGLNPSDPNDPVNFVNQSDAMIGHFGKSAPEVSDKLVPRLEWAAANQRIFDQCKLDMITGTIVKVSKVKTAFLNQRDLAVMGGAEHCYQIEVKRKNFVATYHALKVVVATGAGQHKTPDDVAKLAQRYPSLFMDMDTFARRPELRTEGKRIAILGGNAAVDTADYSAYSKCTVYWLASNPALLGTPHQKGARAVAAKAKKAGDPGLYPLDRKVKDPASIQVTGGNVIKLRLANGWELEADHYVWGIGQDSAGAVNFIDSGLLDGLEPIYDTNQRFGLGHESVLGFQLEGTSTREGFEVVGALSLQVLRARGDKGIRHTYLRDLERVIGELQTQLNLWNQDVAGYGYDVLLMPLSELAGVPPKKLISSMRFVKKIMSKISPTWINVAQSLGAMIINWAIAKQFLDAKGGKVEASDLDNALQILTPSTLGSPQLGNIRALTAAMSGFMPAYVSNNDVNWSHDDQTVLRVFIAVNYPCVPEDDCQRIIQQMIKGRRTKERFGTEKGWGYSPEEVQKFKDELKAINDRWAATLTVAKTSGTGRTVLD